MWRANGVFAAVVLSAAACGDDGTAPATSGTTGVTTGSGGASSASHSGSGGGAQNSASSSAGGGGQGGTGGGEPGVQGDPPLWSKGFDFLNTQSHVRAIAASPTGGPVVVGSFRDTLDVGGGPLVALEQDGFVAAFSEMGDHIFSLRLGSNTQGVPESAHDVACDAAGNVLVTGEFAGDVDFGGGSVSALGEGDGFVAVYNAAGGFLWARTFGGPGVDRVSTIALDDSGAIFIGGAYTDTITFDSFTLTAMGGSGFVAKLDAGGTAIWAVNGRGGSRLASDGQGGVVGNAGARVCRYDAAGIESLCGLYGFGTTFQEDIAALSDGSPIFTGGFDGTINFEMGPMHPDGSDAFIARLDVAATSAAWAKQFGDAESQAISGVARDAMDNIVIAGEFYGTVDFQGGTLHAGSGGALSLAKLTAAGAHVWSRAFPAISCCLGDHRVAIDPNGYILTAGKFGVSLDLGNGLLPPTSGGMFIARFPP